MKKVIDGKLYNTETAKLLGEWSNGYSSRDFDYVAENLYLTKSGAYFLYGEGGARSKYAEARGNNSWGGGEKIQPMSPKAAREWAEKHLTGDEYADIFGEPEEAGDTKTTIMLSISIECKRKMEKLREETGKSISQIVEEKFSE